MEYFRIKGTIIHSDVIFITVFIYNMGLKENSCFMTDFVRTWTATFLAHRVLQCINY